MATVKHADFDNIIAANTWISLNKGSIQVLKLENVLEDWAYPTSVQLKRPRILLKYLDFRDDN